LIYKDCETFLVCLSKSRYNFNAILIFVVKRDKAMDKTTTQNIQDAFLNTARRDRTTVTIHLLPGATLSGRIKSFDKFSVLLDASGQDFLIFKHAISTITIERRRPETPEQ
jgi:host factor-I protein